MKSVNIGIQWMLVKTVYASLYTKKSPKKSNVKKFPLKIWPYFPKQLRNWNYSKLEVSGFWTVRWTCRRMRQSWAWRHGRTLWESWGRRRVYGPSPRRSTPPRQSKPSKYWLTRMERDACTKESLFVDQALKGWDGKKRKSKWNIICNF